MILGNEIILREGPAWTGPGGRVPLGAVWVRMPRFIGDAVMIHQALEPLRAAGMPLVAWGPPAVAELFAGSAAFAGVWADGPERDSAWALRRLLRDARARAVLNLPRSTRALLAAWLARVPLRAGWREGGGRLLATRSLPFRTQGHQLERYAALISAAFPGLAPAPAQPFRPRTESLEAGAQALRELGLEPPFVALALGAMSPTKRLGTGVWVALIRNLKAQGVPHVLLGGAGADEAQAAAIRDAEPGVPDLTGRLSLSVSAAIVARAAALVGNDSALSHLAAACGTPALVVFGPTVPAATAPVGPRVRILRREDLPCLECQAYPCAMPGHPCMEAIPADKLLEELNFLLNPAAEATMLPL